MLMRACRVNADRSVENETCCDAPCMTTQDGRCQLVRANAKPAEQMQSSLVAIFKGQAHRCGDANGFWKMQTQRDKMETWKSLHSILHVSVQVNSVQTQRGERMSAVEHGAEE